MFKSLFTKTWQWFVIIGLVAYAFGLTYTGFSVVSEQYITYGSFTWFYYKIDVFNYIKSLETSLDINQIGNLNITPPQLPGLPNWANILDVLKYLVNTLMIYLTNWVIFILDGILLKPLQLILYPVNILYAILGLNTASNDWVKLFKMLYGASLPQIPYI